jgi:hypothetical protein
MPPPPPTRDQLEERRRALVALIGAALRNRPDHHDIPAWNRELDRLNRELAAPPPRAPVPIAGLTPAEASRLESLRALVPRMREMGHRQLDQHERDLAALEARAARGTSRHDR